MKKNAKFYSIMILLVAVAAGFFVSPKGFGGKYRPWKLGLDLIGGAHLTYNVDLSKVPEADRDNVVNGLRDVIERRVNQFGVAEPQVYSAQAQGQTQLVVELAGIKDVSAAIAQIGETPFLEFKEVQGEGTSTQYLPTELNGRYVKGAQVSFANSGGGGPEVSIQFNDEGAKLFEEITGRNVGKPLAIFLDNQLIEAPRVQQKISGGSAVITGQFSLKDARTLVERFNAGALPAPITLVNQQTISPALGADSMDKAIVAGIAGTLIVMLFMILYYGGFGVIAAVALLVYIVFSLAIFKLVPVTMTLAGVAGFILTIGMAVDANILIFERIKEEKHRGLTKTSSVEEGFRRAWNSIRDSNTSTIITALILYYFTSSFVRGFALTLLLGVLVSLFSAITTTRLFLRATEKQENNA
jgi:protein-export SecD/SecF family membrane protein